MFEDIKTLKAFIVWAKDQGIKSFKVGEVEIELSPKAEEPVDSDPDTKAEEPVDSDPDKKAVSKLDTKTWLESQEDESKEDEDELMYWSSKG